jgi:hypothetical protein
VRYVHEVGMLAENRRGGLTLRLRYGCGCRGCASRTAGPHWAPLQGFTVLRCRSEF